MGDRVEVGLPAEDDYATFELYEVGRAYPEIMVAEVSGPREAALREIMHYALMYGQDGPVSVRQVLQSNQEPTL